MKLAIISDLHDNLANTAKCLFCCAANEVTELICCGDVTNSDTIEFLAANFPSAIYLVRGNVCNYEASLWAAAALYATGENYQPFVPYLSVPALMVVRPV